MAGKSIIENGHQAKSTMTKDEKRLRHNEWARQYRERNPQKIAALNKSWRERNRVSHAEYLARYYRENLERFKIYGKSHRIKNRAKLDSQIKEWRAKNPEKCFGYRQNARRTARLKDPEGFKKKQRENMARQRAKKGGVYFGTLLRCRLNDALKHNGKRSSALVLLGCSIDLFKLHLQNQFRDGMNWNNQGKHWEIDHIRPCAAFDLSKLEDQAVCFHYSNMQPLLVTENRRKSDKLGDQLSRLGIKPKETT